MAHRSRFIVPIILTIVALLELRAARRFWANAADADDDTATTTARAAWRVLALCFLQAGVGTQVLAFIQATSAPHRVYLLDKQLNGSHSLRAWVLFWPYLICYRSNVYVRRWLCSFGEPVATLIADGFLIAGWPTSRRQLLDALDSSPNSGEKEAKGQLRKGFALLDLTCELPNVLQTDGYCCCPTWDTMAPSLEDIERGVQWGLEQHQAGKYVVVHCAFGHGRSLTMLIALLIATGVASSVANGEAIVKKFRPRVRTTSIQRNVLRRWLEKSS